MKSPIGHTFMFNFIILFIFIVFAFLAATISYYKAFKVNNRIVYSIEKYEGFNYKDDTKGSNGNILDSSYEEIQVYLTSIGYRGATENEKCPSHYDGMPLVELEIERSHRYCIYLDQDAIEKTDTEGQPVCTKYYQFGVLTYMNINLPLIELVDFPVFTKTNRIYKFTTDNTCT